jgi:branched-subunit amino acid transport protein
LKTDNAYLWTIIILSAIATFSIRFFFIQIKKVPLSGTVKDIFSFIPPAVLSALVFGSVFEKGLSSLTLRNPYLWASILAGVTAVTFKNVLLTIITGMVFIWSWNYFY